MSHLGIGGLLGVIPGALAGWGLGVLGVTRSCRDCGFEAVGWLEGGAAIGAVIGCALGVVVAHMRDR